MDRLGCDTEDQLRWCWAFWARPSQLPPPGRWRFWFLDAGRGFGKTRAGAEWTHRQAHRYEWISLVAPTLDDVRELMIEGESGLLATAPPWWRPVWNANRRRLTWPNGARARYYTADEPDRLRGKQHQVGWLEEPGSWRYPEAWDQFLLGLRLPPDPRALITGTPRPVRIIRALLTDPTCVVTRGSTYENTAHLAEAFRDEVIRRYEGTKLGRQELYAELVEDDEEAVVPRGWLTERCRPATAPQLRSGATLGVDVGAGGDDTAVALRVGHAYRLLRRWPEPDTMAAADAVVGWAREHGVTDINVDVIGVGKGLHDRLLQLRAEGVVRAQVHAVNVAEASDDDDLYVLLRDQLWWQGRQAAEHGRWDLTGLDEDTLDELAAPHYSYGPRGRVKVERKADTRARLGRSPDGADAVLLAAYSPAAARHAVAW